MSTVLITGGTGLIGQALTKLLVEKGYQVIILTQHPDAHHPPSSPNVKYAAWNVKQQTIDADALGRADYIVHLAGEGVADKRWSARRKKEIVTSRTEGSAFLVQALKNLPNKIKTVVSSSAIGWYGDDARHPNSKPFVESDPPDQGFLGETCRLWEAHIEPVAQTGRRLVIIRTGITLSVQGGALKEFLKPVRFGVAAIIGTGKQIISWIHMDDLCRMYLMALENESMSGVYNAVAPKPVSNKELTLKLAEHIKKGFFIPLYVPSFMLKLGIGEMSEEVLKSATVCCDKIRMAGFSFTYPSIESAVGDLLKPDRS